MSLRGRLRPPVVLAYHGVGEVTDEVDPNRLVLAPGLLEDQIRLLLRRGYRFVTSEQLADESGGSRPAPGTAVLTFDDGWLDGDTTVRPMLARLGVAATFYVCPDWLGGHHPDVKGPAGALMHAREVEALAAAGMEVASHTLRHRNLCLLDDTDLDEDLVMSRHAVSDVTGRPCRTLAYPFGFHDPRVEAAAERAGYDLALAWVPGPWRPFAVPRMPAPPRHGARRLGMKMLGVRRPQRLSWSA